MPAKRELSMRQLRHLLRLHHDGVSAREIGRMLGVGERTESVSLERMSELGGVRGVRLSLNKRLSAERTKAELGWAPQRLGVLADVEFGSYAPPTTN